MYRFHFFPKLAMRKKRRKAKTEYGAQYMEQNNGKK
jgi:hypothetical protein